MLWRCVWLRLSFVSFKPSIQSQRKEAISYETSSAQSKKWEEANDRTHVVQLIQATAKETKEQTTATPSKAQKKNGVDKGSLSVYTVCFRLVCANGKLLLSNIYV